MLITKIAAGAAIAAASTTIACWPSERPPVDTSAVNAVLPKEQPPTNLPAIDAIQFARGLLGRTEDFGLVNHIQGVRVCLWHTEGYTILIAGSDNSLKTQQMRQRELAAGVQTRAIYSQVGAAMIDGTPYLMQPVAVGYHALMLPPKSGHTSFDVWLTDNPLPSSVADADVHWDWQMHF